MIKIDQIQDNKTENHEQETLANETHFLILSTRKKNNPGTIPNNQPAAVAVP